VFVTDYWSSTDYDVGIVAFSDARPSLRKPSSVAVPMPKSRLSKEPERVRVEFPETWLWSSESVAGYTHARISLHCQCLGLLSLRPFGSHFCILFSCLC